MATLLNPPYRGNSAGPEFLFLTVYLVATHNQQQSHRIYTTFFKYKLRIEMFTASWQDFIV